MTKEHPHAMMETRDLSLPDALAALIRRRRFVLAATLCAGLLGTALAFGFREVYEGSMLISINGRGPGQLQQLAQQFSGVASLAGLSAPATEDNDRSSAVATLTSYDLLAAFVSKPEIHNKLEIESHLPRWVPIFMRGDKALSTWKAVELLEKYIAVEEDKSSGLITLSAYWYDPHSAATWANQLVRLADDKLRARSQRNSKERIARLTRDYEISTIVATRDSISGVLANELRTLALSQADDNFTYKIIDPAVPAERPVRPRKALIVVLFTGLGLLFAVTGVLVSAQRRTE